MKDKYENKANCNLTTCRYNEDGKCTNEAERLSPSELLMHLSDGIGHTEALKKFGIEIDLKSLKIVGSDLRENFDKFSN